jgi:hypothetical protein
MSRSVLQRIGNTVPECRRLKIGLCRGPSRGDLPQMFEFGVFFDCKVMEVSPASRVTIHEMPTFLPCFVPCPLWMADPARQTPRTPRQIRQPRNPA